MDFLKVFLALQGQESRRRQLRDAVARCPQQLEAEKARFLKEQAQHQEWTTRAIDLKRKRGELETLQHTKDDLITRDKARMSNIQNNTEYQALLREIDQAEHEKSEAARTIATIDKELADVDASLAGGRGGFEAARAEHEQRLAAIEAEKREREAELASLEAERAEVAAGLSREHVNLYEQLALKRGGQVVVPAMAGGCGGCHVKLRPALLSQLKQKTGLIRCDSCSRILYLPEEAVAVAKTKSR